jgi:Ser/Thr protein kinase RdoA (MazF antagonist)
LPRGLPVPRLIDVYDDGEWVALTFQDVRGRHPRVPWQPGELGHVVAALADLGSALRPAPWPGAPWFAEANPELVNAWRDVAEAPPPRLEPWLHRELDRMVAEKIDIPGLVHGDALLHTDLRADNLLLTATGEVVFLDWAWTCRGAPWLDLLLFAIAVNAEGGVDTELLVRGHPLTRDLPSRSIDAVLVAVGVAFWTSARLPEPPALAGIRAFQHAYADATLQWVRRRLA